MTQHGEDPAVVRGLPNRFTRTVRSAAITAGLALTLAASAAMPLAGVAHAQPATALAASAQAVVTAIPHRPDHQHGPRSAGPVAAASVSKSSTADGVHVAAAGAASAPATRAALGATGTATTASAQLLLYRTRASRTRGQPDVG